MFYCNVILVGQLNGEMQCSLKIPGQRTDLGGLTESRVSFAEAGEEIAFVFYCVWLGNRGRELWLQEGS